MASETHSLALWFWNNILNRQDNPWENMGSFKRYLKEASQAVKKYNLDIDILKHALLEMRRAGIDVQSIHLPILWTKTTNGPTWYEESERYLKTPPPHYYCHEFAEWCKLTGNEHLLEELDD